MPLRPRREEARTLDFSRGARGGASPGIAKAPVRAPGRSTRGDAGKGRRCWDSGFPQRADCGCSFQVLPDSKDTDFYMMSHPIRMHLLSAHKLFMLVAVVMMAGVEATGSTPTYQWRDYDTGEQVTCDKCRPGYFVASHCTRESPTNCQPCPALHYTEFWNYVEECRYCNVFCGELELEAQPCTATQNRQCKCQPGFFLDSEFCIEHSLCPPGFGVLKPGTEHEDTQCRRCPMGTFSNGSSSTQSCQPHRNCHKEGLEVNVLGTRYHDTLCMACRWENINSTQEECEQALVDFLVSRISKKQLKRLLRQPVDFEKPPTHRHQNMKFRKKLHTFMVTLKDANPDQSPITGLLNLLEKANLNSIKKDIQKRFYKAG